MYSSISTFNWFLHFEIIFTIDFALFVTCLFTFWRKWLKQKNWLYSMPINFIKLLFRDQKLSSPPYSINSSLVSMKFRWTDSNFLSCTRKSTGYIGLLVKSVFRVTTGVTKASVRKQIIQISTVRVNSVYNL